ncbi:MAG TPA: hypothetical protein VLH56_19090 [Dissulfurispiraceae bacterium]|nr:hypothetical protein [Dissulfurispiraceae bacterium]
MKKTITHPDFQQNAAHTVSDYLLGLGRPVYMVETEQARYMGNTLTQALQMYQRAQDSTEVKDVTRVG